MPDIACDDNSEYWAEYTQEFLGFTPDVVFTSEEYGEPWAKALGCEHVSVDPDRKTYPVSGTMLRKNPLSHLEHVEPITRSMLVKRVAIVGAESTGTTTLAQDLGEYFSTSAVPEFGRLRDEAKMARDGKPHDWPSEDFLYTARVQQAMEDQFARTANRVLICDTDALATFLWHKRYLGYLDPHLLEVASSREYDLYIVTDHAGIEPEDDGFRFNMHERPDMQKEFIHYLKYLERPFIVATGNRSKRLQQAVAAIAKLL